MIQVNGPRCPTLQDFEVATGVKPKRSGWVRCPATLEWHDGGAVCVNKSAHGNDGHVWAKRGSEPRDYLERA